MIGRLLAWWRERGGERACFAGRHRLKPCDLTDLPGEDPVSFAVLFSGTLFAAPFRCERCGVVILRLPSD